MGKILLGKDVIGHVAGLRSRFWEFLGRKMEDTEGFASGNLLQFAIEHGHGNS